MAAMYILQVLHLYMLSKINATPPVQSMISTD